MYKKISLIVIVIIFVIIIYFIIERKPQELIIATVKEAYNTVSLVDKSDNLKINLYINQDNTIITDKSRIANAQITDKLLNNIIKVEVYDISLLGSVNIDKRKYFCYQYSLQIDGLKNNIEIENAYLRLNYYSHDDIILNIGSISIYKVRTFENDDLRITNIKGVVNKIDDKKTLVGIVLRLDNLSGKEITITNIEPLDLNLTCSDCINIEGKRINSSDDISSILGYNYNLSHQRLHNFNIIIDENIYFLFSISYLNHYEIPSCGLKITYIIHNNEKEMIYDDFQFFINHQRYVDISELTFYYYENN